MGHEGSGLQKSGLGHYIKFYRALTLRKTMRRLGEAGRGRVAAKEVWGFGGISF